MRKIIFILIFLFISVPAFAEEDAEKCYKDCMVSGDKDHITCGIRCSSELEVEEDGEAIEKDPNCMKDCKDGKLDNSVCELMCNPGERAE